jgi:hypothetical protein
MLLLRLARALGPFGGKRQRLIGDRKAFKDFTVRCRYRLSGAEARMRGPLAIGLRVLTH